MVDAVQFLVLQSISFNFAFIPFQRKSLLEVIKETILSHLTKKCPPHVSVYLLSSIAVLALTGSQLKLNV